MIQLFSVIAFHLKSLFPVLYNYSLIFEKLQNFLELKTSKLNRNLQNELHVVLLTRKCGRLILPVATKASEKIRQ